MNASYISLYKILNFFHFIFCVNFTEYHITTAFHQAV